MATAEWARPGVVAGARPAPSFGEIRHPRALTEVASGIDACYLSGGADLPTHLTDELEEAKVAAIACRLGALFFLGETPFRLLPHAWGRYRFVMVNEMGRIGFTTSSHLPAIRIQPASSFLHAVGTETAIGVFSELIAQAVGEVTFSVSRLDLYVDVTGWAPTGDDRHNFVTRTESVRTFEETGAWTGFSFGSRSSGTICARIYDKSADVAAKGTDWWAEVWGERWRPGDCVVRVEFEFGRKGLGEFSVDSPADAFAGLGDLWGYATEQWLTLRTPIADGTKSRWPVAPEWEDIQNATLAARAVGLQRTRNGARVGSLRKLLPGLNGYLASFAAIVGTDDIDDTIEAVGPYLRDYETVRRICFAERVKRRRAEHPDTVRVGGGG